MKRITILCLLCAGLMGCATPQQIDVRDNATCRSWGADPGTDGYLQCRALLHQQAAMDDQARRDRAMMLSGALLSR